MQSATKSEPEGAPSLQKIVDSHLERLRSLQDRVGVLLCGLQGVSESSFHEGRRSQPTEPLGELSEPFPWMLSASNAWLAAHYLSELFALNSVYFEQLRQFTILVEVSREPIADSEKMQEAKRRIEDRPVILAEVMKALGGMLTRGFPRLDEVGSLQKLHQCFAGVAAGQIPTVRLGSIVLCRPETKGLSGAANFEVQPHKLPDIFFTKPSLTRELFFQIYFTAFVLCRDLAEAVKATAVGGAEEDKSKSGV